MNALRRNDIVALVFVALAIAIAAALIARAPQPDRYVDTFSTHDSDVGGYLAWYRLLERSGVRVERFERAADFLDPSIATLIVENDGDFYEHDVAFVTRFVERGGTLVWISSGNDEGEKAWKPMRFPRFVVVPKRIARGAQTALVPAPDLRDVHRLVIESTTRLQTDSFPPVVPLFGDRAGAIVARYRLGNGFVTIVTDPTIFTNRALAKRDDARLSLALAVVPKNGLVAFEESIHGFGQERSAWDVFPSPIRWAVIGLVVVAFLAWIGANARVAPLAAPPQAPEANASLYIASLATLLHRGKAAHFAAHDLVVSTFAACARALGITGVADESRLVAGFTARGDASSAELVRNVARESDRDPLDDAALVRIAAWCRTLRMEAQHGRGR